MRLVLALLFASALCSGAAETAVGRWEGSIQIPGKETKLFLDLAGDRSGAWVGSVIIPGLNIKGASLTGIVEKDGKFTFTLKALGGTQIVPATFALRLEQGQLRGEFVEGGNKAPVILEKAGPPQVELPPQSTAVAKELEAEWKGEYEFAGYVRHVDLKISNHTDGHATAEFVIVGKRTNNLPVDLITQEDNLLTVESHAIGISYEGSYQNKTSEIRGTLIQGSIELPLVMKRVL